jgi:hypothetical protein
MPFYFDVTDSGGSTGINAGGPTQLSAESLRAAFLADHPVGYVVGAVYEASPGWVRSHMVGGLVRYGRKDGTAYEKMTDGTTREVS